MIRILLAAFVMIAVCPAASANDNPSAEPCLVEIAKIEAWSAKWSPIVSAKKK